MSIANELAPNFTRAIIAAPQPPSPLRGSDLTTRAEPEVGALVARKELELIGGPKKVFNRGSESSVTTWQSQP
jgi:hypothetical protein